MSDSTRQLPPEEVSQRGYAAYGADPVRPNIAAILSLVCGVIALALSWLPGVNVAAVVLAIVAIVAGTVGLSRGRDPRAGGRGAAGTGLFLGLLAFVVSVLVYVVLAQAMRTMLQDPAFGDFGENFDRAMDRAIDQELGERASEAG
ncbi:MAG: hypothetical protein M3415_06080 [Actinomycetota bacterium]|jgi:uncharacterized membrane protein|nr:hypothetical protein [Actinomycetota bacterium]